MIYSLWQVSKLLLTIIKNTPPILNIRIINHRRIYQRRHLKKMKQIQELTIETLIHSNQKLNVFEKIFIQKSNHFILNLINIQNTFNDIFKNNFLFIQNEFYELNTCICKNEYILNDLLLKLKESNLQITLIEMYENKLNNYHQELFDLLELCIKNTMNECNEKLVDNNHLLIESIEKLDDMNCHILLCKEIEYKNGSKYDIIINFLNRTKNKIELIENYNYKTLLVH